MPGPSFHYHYVVVRSITMVYNQRSRKIYLHELKQLENEGFRVHRDGFSGQYSATKIPAEELASVRAGAK